VSFFLLLESGDHLLQESSDKILLEDLATLADNASLLNMGWPAFVLGPLMDGSFSQGELQHLLHLYAGILLIPKAQAIGLPTSIQAGFYGKGLRIATDREVGSPQTVRTLERR